MNFLPFEPLVCLKRVILWTGFREKIFIGNYYCGLTKTKSKNAAYPISAYVFYSKLEKEEKSFNDNLYAGHEGETSHNLRKSTIWAQAFFG